MIKLFTDFLDKMKSPINFSTFFSRERKWDSSSSEFHIIFRSSKLIHQHKPSEEPTVLQTSQNLGDSPAYLQVCPCPPCPNKPKFWGTAIAKAFAEPVRTHSLLSFHFMLLTRLQRIHIHFQGYTKYSVSTRRFLYHHSLAFLCTPIRTDEPIPQ